MEEGPGLRIMGKVSYNSGGVVGGVAGSQL